MAGGDPGAGGLGRLGDDVFGFSRVAVEPVPQVFVADLLDEGLGFGVAEFGFGLAFELGVGEFHRDDGGEAFPDVVAGEVLVLVPQQFLVAGVPVDDGGECGAEASSWVPPSAVLMVLAKVCTEEV